MRLIVLFVSVAILGSLGNIKAEGEKSDSVKVKKNRVEAKSDSCPTETAEKIDKSFEERKDEVVCEKRDSTKTNSKIKNSNKKVVVL